MIFSITYINCQNKNKDKFIIDDMEIFSDDQDWSEEDASEEDNQLH